ncbi:MAG TPA: NAD-dependent succinate-semialdehyde dehydrogenase [Acidimicrobiales bacterium]|jgi:succinate-semialdehyde dehydrogenase/glutarate-semialdehyde dehydrogenase|nr:NAD-dependent succinate-semialdehyde dehydrogenase [Acidimicrobiales bacterium]
MSLTRDEQRVVDAVPKDLLIDGRWQPAAGGATLAVEDPATGEVIAEVADGSSEDALAALAAAHGAQREWAATAPRARSEILRRAFDALTARADDLALLMTLEMGKPVAESKAEISYAAEFFRWFSEEAVRIEGGYRVAPAGGARLIVMRQPVGPALLITPWNFPMAMGTRKVGPAVAAGCTMVLKPAELTPLSSLALADILIECGLPSGVLNVVTTSDAGATTGPLIHDARLRKLSFTGSTAVGKSLIEASADQILRVSMELGGNAPFLVFADADLDAAVDGAMLAKMRNGGEACTSANRFHVEESIAADFADRLAQRMAGLKMARGTEEGAQVGPLINPKQLTKVVDLVDDAVAQGARVVCGGTAPDGPGYFYQPSVLYPVPESARMRREEIFGPVAPIYPFATETEAIAAANDTEYGLVAYVYTRDLDRAVRVAEGIQSGMVGINQGVVSNPAAPFGGVKQSGFGREGGQEGIEEYLEVKYIGLKA